MEIKEIIMFIRKVFKAEDFDDFNKSENQNLAADEVLEFYKFHCKEDIDPTKIKRMEKYFQSALDEKNKKIKGGKKKKISSVYPADLQGSQNQKKKKLDLPRNNFDISEIVMV